ncbi:MAG: molybdate ABC transporter substrate-binding protein [Hungatella sp.]|nr:molybdate ABC transporter substrate-binding protein [Hungatella sp.]
MKKYWAAIVAAGLISGMAAGCSRTKPAAMTEGTAVTETTASETENGRNQTDAETETAEGESVDLIVFAAASMTEALTQIAEMYKEVNPNVRIIYTFDSSGTLKTQIQEGADCDIFISAAQKQMDQLDILADPSVNTERLDLTGLGIMEQLEASSKITYGSNVKEVTTQVKEASVDCGIIYATDAFSAGLTVVDEAEEGQCRQVIYPAAVLNISGNQEEARTFLDYLLTDQCAEIFEAVGFTMAQ